MNEGWTTYCERILIRQLQGEAGRGFSYIIGQKSLKDSLKEYEKAGQHNYQKLEVPFQFGEDPDDAFSTVPYDKVSQNAMQNDSERAHAEVRLCYSGIQSPSPPRAHRRRT